MAVPAASSRRTALALMDIRAAASDPTAARDRRDPRAAPLPVHKNVSVAESCRFYGVQDAISTCRVPRSCQDCLQMPGCVLTTNGQCRDVREFTNSTNDYHNTLVQYPSGDAYDVSVLVAKNYQAHHNNFYSANATYCHESDAVCSQCRASFTSLASSPRTARVLDTQFCVGEGGCVCVAVCEVPGLLSVRAYDDQCSFDHGAPSFKDPDGVDLPVFTTRRRDPRAPLSSFVLTRNGQDTCGFYDAVDIQGARQPRSCSDCLQKQGCMISLAEGEMCTTMDSYSGGLDFQSQPRNFPGAIWFPSDETTYCPASDPVCAKCRQNFTLSTAKDLVELSDEWSHRNKSSFCVGEGGCVCIELCEKAPDWVANAYVTYIGCWNGSGYSTMGTSSDCYYTNETDENGCRKPRSCGDCLQKPGCTLSVANGLPGCVETTNDPSLSDFRLESAQVSTNAPVQFLSNATKYCSTRDPICTKCTAYYDDAIRSRNVPSPRAEYCVGEDGCVCIARCEIPSLFLADARDTRYTTASVRPSAESFIVLASGVLIIGFVVFWMTWWQRDKRARQEPEPVSEETRRHGVVRGPCSTAHQRYISISMDGGDSTGRSG